jgi:hypothetical protein
MPTKFVVKKGPTGKFRFSLRAGNGEAIATLCPVRGDALDGLTESGTCAGSLGGLGSA